MRTRLMAVGVVVLACAGAGVERAAGQCRPGWQAGRGIAGILATDGETASGGALTTWDPDGPGPRQPVLVVGGHFNLAGAVEAVSIAMWDGAAWAPIGEGLAVGSATGVRAVVVYQGQLIAGGDVLGAGAEAISGVARWDGTAWRAMGAEFSSVTSLAEYNGALYAAGVRGGVAPHISRWDGTRWADLPGAGNPDQWPACMAVFDGRLVAGGAFASIGSVAAAHIAAWDGAAWSPVGGGTDGEVDALTVFRGDLAAAGRFGSAGGAVAHGVARWDGAAWSGLGAGAVGDVTALTAFGNDLIAAGDFRGAAGAGALGAARWDGAAWHALGSGFRWLGVAGLGSFQGELVAGGYFNVAGEAAVANIAKWSGAAWSAVEGGETVPVSALASFGVHAAAVRNADAGTSVWMVDTNQQLGPAFRGPIAGLVFDGSSLIAGGTFRAIGEEPIAKVAAWDGSAWRAMGDPGITVSALALHQGAVIAAGWSAALNGTVVVQRTGSAWAVVSPPVAGDVRAMFDWDGVVYLGGTFSVAGRQYVRVARLGAAGWEPVGQDLPHEVDCFAVYNNELIAGGWFTGSGSGAINGVARFDGSAWRPLGAGLVTHVAALATVGPDLIATGDFMSSGSAPVSRIARWDGSAWSSVDEGLDGSGVALLARGDGLLVGGTFLHAGSRVSPYLARLACDCYANCDNSTMSPTLNVSDFLCFMSRFAAASGLPAAQQVSDYANCDGSSVAPVLNIGDFVCFQGRFAAGCR